MKDTETAGEMPMKSNHCQSRFRLIILCGIAAMLGCNAEREKDFLGSAVVECRTYDVATTAQGRIMALYTDEGRAVAKDELTAVIDTVPLTLQKQEILADMEELGSSIASQEAQNKSLEADATGAEREFNRAEELVKQGSGTEQQRDLLGTQLQSTQLRVTAMIKEKMSLIQKNKELASRLAQVEDQIRRCYVASPSSGIVLTRYRNTGEVVAPANPIFNVGEFDTMYADFFVPQPELATLALGQTVRIRLDYQAPRSREPARFIPGIITWIGSEAEFSPKNIQTRQSRNELVFRIRATIPNADGSLKRGLPVEVWR
jgi:HlyD family secretion protein